MKCYFGIFVVVVFLFLQTYLWPYFLFGKIHTECLKVCFFFIKNLVCFFGVCESEYCAELYGAIYGINQLSLNLSISSHSMSSSGYKKKKKTKERKRRHDHDHDNDMKDNSRVLIHTPLVFGKWPRHNLWTVWKCSSISNRIRNSIFNS